MIGFPHARRYNPLQSSKLKWSFQMIEIANWLRVGWITNSCGLSSGCNSTAANICSLSHPSTYSSDVDAVYFLCQFCPYLYLYMYLHLYVFFRIKFSSDICPFSYQSTYSSDVNAVYFWWQLSFLFRSKSSALSN